MPCSFLTSSLAYCMKENSLIIWLVCLQSSPQQPTKPFRNSPSPKPWTSNFTLH